LSPAETVLLTYDAWNAAPGAAGGRSCSRHGGKALLHTDTDGLTPTETRVAEIWADVLKHDQFGLDDNFFAIGGHSMYATLVTYELRNSWGSEFPLTLIFEFSTVRELAKEIDEITSGSGGGAAAAAG
jgi:acyl carrier protein